MRRRITMTIKKRIREIMSLRMMPVLVAGLILAVLAVGGYAVWSQAQTPRNVTVTYNYDPVGERWVKAEESVKVTPNPDGTYPRPSNTIIINVNENNPVKRIIIAEALVINGNEPMFEINGAGDTPLSSGKINFGTVLFDEVDAKQLEVDADVVRTSFTNVVAKDNELDLDLDVVNVIRTSRGAASSLFIGISRADLVTDFDTIDTVDIDLIRSTTRETGIRVDRIRILGPSSGTAFIELLIVKRTAVMGKIDIDNVGIQDFILRQVTLDDNP
jgi:hypothetical protein